MRWASALIASSCRFKLNDLEFNLCPLLNKPGTELDISFSQLTPPTNTSYRYTLGLGTPIQRDVTLPADLQCEEGTYLCLVVLNTRPNHPSEPARYLQVVPIATTTSLNPKAKLLEKALPGDLHEPMQLTLHGGLYNGLSQKAAFIFHCDHAIEEPSSPQFSWQFNGTHTFSWRTSHACPLNFPHGSPSQPIEDQPDPDPPARPPPDPDADNPPHRGSSHLALFYVLMCASVIYILLRYILPSHSRSRHISSFQSFMTLRRGRRKPAKSFRPPAESLVQWAEEEQLDDYEIDDSTPLTPTFKRAFTASSQYGSAG
ncbi:Autophagy-related protein 27 [Mycena indigotica]|uniref:Autophagy-related protein 27 n=1 Tax=Mycena indigotica TaxID=2126181 RepID=A0A8H6W4W1_9AGAR|nr:Autophagy-related protein 27 [Mycena indigotica]KAF7301878.1 Autophagy-related protein 27 [Mycena indigotica]